MLVLLLEPDLVPDLDPDLDLDLDLDLFPTLSTHHPVLFDPSHWHAICFHVARWQHIAQRRYAGSDCGGSQSHEAGFA